MFWEHIPHTILNYEHVIVYQGFDWKMVDLSKLIKKKNLEIIDIVNCISFSKVCIYSYMTNFELSDVTMHADLLFSIAN